MKGYNPLQTPRPGKQKHTAAEIDILGFSFMSPKAYMYSKDGSSKLSGTPHRPPISLDKVDIKVVRLKNQSVAPL